MLESEIKKLTAAIEALTAKLGDAPTLADPAPAVTPEPAPPTKKNDQNFEVITPEELTRKCLNLSKNGHKDAIKEQLANLGVTRLSQLTGDDFTAFSKWVEGVK